MEGNKFSVILLPEAKAFISRIPIAAGDKLFANMRRIQQGERNAELFKKLDNTDIWEFRALYNGIQYRLFAFWDTEKNALVVATHGIIKKTQKTPVKEIAKAEAIRKGYLKSK